MMQADVSVIGDRASRFASGGGGVEGVAAWWGGGGTGRWGGRGGAGWCDVTIKRLLRPVQSGSGIPGDVTGEGGASFSPPHACNDDLEGGGGGRFVSMFLLLRLFKRLYIFFFFGA